MKVGGNIVCMKSFIHQLTTVFVISQQLITILLSHEILYNEVNAMRIHV